jgi:hypothetical protein
LLSTVDPADLRKTSCYSNVGHGDLTLSEASRTRRKVFCRAPPRLFDNSNRNQNSN